MAVRANRDAFGFNLLNGLLKRRVGHQSINVLFVFAVNVMEVDCSWMLEPTEMTLKVFFVRKPGLPIAPFVDGNRCLMFFLVAQIPVCSCNPLLNLSDFRVFDWQSKLLRIEPQAIGNLFGQGIKLIAMQMPVRRFLNVEFQVNYFVAR